MSAYERNNRITERITADGTVNGGRPVKRLLFVGQLSGAGAANVEWYDDTTAGTAANKRGGLTSGAATTWAWTLRLEQEFKTALFFDLAANSAEVIAVYVA